MLLLVTLTLPVLFSLLIAYCTALAHLRLRAVLVGIILPRDKTSLIKPARTQYQKTNQGLALEGIPSFSVTNL